MTMKIKKCMAALALLSLSAFAAPEAAAYKRVCMKADFGIGYAFKFRVIWASHWEIHSARWERRPFNPDGFTDWSGDVHLLQTRCIPIDQIPSGSYFLVRIQAIGMSNQTVCKDWANRDDFLGEKVPGRENLSLWLNAWGRVMPDSIRCKAWKFE